MPGINRNNAHASGQKHCLWGCAGLWRGLWGRSQPPVPSPGRYLAAEDAALSETNCPTSAGLAPPGHRTARKRLQSAPPAGTQAVGRCQLLFMYRVSVGFFRWADFGFLARWSWFEPKAAYTHLLTQRKCRLLTFCEPLGAMWHLAGLIWVPGGVCPTPHISYTYGPSGPWPATP
jgi:hypothetical protein